MKKALVLFLTLALMMTLVTVTAVSVNAGEKAEIAETGLAAPEVQLPELVYDGILVKWKAVSGVAKYKVFMKEEFDTEDDPWRAVGTSTGTSFTCTKGLTEGVTYGFTVRGMDKNGKYVTDYKKSGRWIIYYEAPRIGSVKAAWQNNTHGIFLNWTESVGLSLYTVYAKVGSGDWTKIDSVYDQFDTFIPDSKLKSGTTYAFTVRASDYGSVKSGYDKAGKKLTYVACPPKIKIENTVEGQKLTYTRQNGAAKYRIFVKKGSSWEKLVDTNSSYVNKNVKSGTNYTYTIRSLNKDGKYVSAYNPDGWSKKFVAAPKIYDISRGDDYFTIRVAVTKPAYGWRVLVKEGSSWKKVDDIIASDFKFTESPYDYPVYCVFYNNAQKGKNYTFTARAFDSAGNYISGYDTTGKSAVFFNINEAPDLQTIANTKDGVKLTWKKRSGVAKYRVFIDKGAGWTKLTDTTALSMTDKTVKDGNFRVYTVRGMDSKGNYNTAFDEYGLPIIWHKPAATQMANDVTVDNSLSAYSQKLGYAPYGNPYRWHCQNGDYLPNDMDGTYQNAGDMTHIVIKYAKKLLDKEADYLKKVGGIQYVSVGTDRREMGGEDWEMRLYYVNYYKPINYEY